MEKYIKISATEEGTRLETYNLLDYEVLGLLEMYTTKHKLEMVNTIINHNKDTSTQDHPNNEHGH